MTFNKFKVEGMTCANCSRAVTDALEQTDGVNRAKVDLSKNIASVWYDEEKVEPGLLKKSVRKAGYDLVLNNEKDRKRALVTQIAYLVIAGIFLVWGIMTAVSHIPGVESSSFGSFFMDPIQGITAGTIAFVVLGLPTIRRAIKALFSKRAGMDALISLSAISSYAVSLYIAIRQLVTGIHEPAYFDALLMVLSIVTIGEFLEYLVKSLSGKKADLDLNKVQGKVQVKYGNSLIEMEREQILSGDVFILPAGSGIPADATVIDGAALVDFSSLTGESTPKEIKAGDKIYAGTTIKEGSLTARADTDALSSLSDRIEKEAYALSYKKGSLGKMSDRIAQWFVPAALLLAILGFLLNFFIPSLAYHDWETSLIRGASVLVVSCPCAFGLAVPLTGLNGFYAALRNGVLFKSGSTFERVKKIEAAFFDKTGTLTSGEMHVQSGSYDDETLAVAKGLEAFSNHPVAKAISALRPEIKPLPIDGVTEIPGSGMKSAEWSLVKAEREDLEKLAVPDGVSVSILKDSSGKIKAWFALEDTILPGVREALDELRGQGIETYILTGDNPTTAERLGDALGFKPENVKSGLLPQDKSKFIKDISAGHFSAYVGDGINDLEALSFASLSIATQKAAQSAKDKADCILLTPGLSSLPKAIRISRKAYRIVLENFGWAFLYNIVLIPLAMTGTLWMWLCAAAMIASNITLMLNSLRASKVSHLKKK